MSTSQIEQSYDTKLKATLNKAGFMKVSKVTGTLQGSIWRAISKKSQKNIIIKVTNKYLHKNAIAISNNRQVHNINENIITEASILKQLSSDKNAPKSILKYYGFFESDTDYLLMMEDGGESVFDFVNKAHKLILSGNIDISEWHRVCKVIMKQLIECIEYLHSVNICHMDISLENILINDVKIHYLENTADSSLNKITFLTDDIQIKICDFGLSQVFNAKCKDFKCNKYVGKSAYRSPEIVSRKRYFNAKSNDIWCIGICLFMIIFGGIPWYKASKTDESFKYIMNGNLLKVLASWNKLCYVDGNLLTLIEHFFKFENERITLKEIINHSWLKH